MATIIIDNNIILYENETILIYRHSVIQNLLNGCIIILVIINSIRFQVITAAIIARNPYVFRKSCICLEQLTAKQYAHHQA